MARTDRCRRLVGGEGHVALSSADTIVALSSGAPPAAIAIIRISGPQAFAAARTLSGPLPDPRRASLRALRDRDGELIDRALVLAFPAAASATGEDLVELHCHGGRAVVAAVQRAVLACDRVRAAEPGEFTRRALLNCRIDLAQAQGLADLLAAETEVERRLAVRAAEGTVSRAIRSWMDRLDDVAAEVEASIDFAEEGDVAAEAASLATIHDRQAALADEIAGVLAAPSVERWRDGWRVVIAGPPNAGKSTLLNLLAQRDAAIVSNVAGTTRDRIEAVVQRDGVGYVLIDTAGLRGTTEDAIEQIGIGLAQSAMDSADLVLWLGDDPPVLGRQTLWIHARADVVGRLNPPAGAAMSIRSDDPQSIERLWALIAASTGGTQPDLPMHRSERDQCEEVLHLLRAAPDDAVLLAEDLRRARTILGGVLGIDTTDALLDRIFGRFCLGK